jgi:hypothetical protein
LTNLKGLAQVVKALDLMATLGWRASCTGPGFAIQEWVHEVALLWGGFPVVEKKSLTSWLSFPFSVGAYFFPQICRWCNNELVPEWTLWLPVRQPSLVSSSWDYFYKRLRLFNSWSKPLSWHILWLSFGTLSRFS